MYYVYLKKYLFSFKIIWWEGWSEIDKEILEIAEQIFKNPELGYREYNTSNIVREFILKYFPCAKIENFARTGIKVNMGNLKEINIALVAELDAVFYPNHFCSASDGAAHNCGHYSQVAIMLYLFKKLATNDAYKNFKYSFSFIFVPAEEYLDLDFRKKLKESGEIQYFGGKPEAMKLGIFDDIDFCIAVHSMGGEFKKRSIEINCDLAGFMYKYYTFKGKASHAGFAPQDGINAYNISSLFNVGLGFLRQHIDERYMVRINPVIAHADMGTNVIPDTIKIGTDIRSNNTDYMQELAKRLDNLAHFSANALGGQAQIESELGYLPFTQNRYLSNFIYESFKMDEKIEFCKNESPVSAAGDIGDLSFMLPCIQIGYSGFKGTIHGKDFVHDDVEYIFGIFPEFLYKTLIYIDGKVEKKYLYKKTYDDYLKILKNFGGKDEE